MEYNPSSLFETNISIDVHRFAWHSYKLQHQRIAPVHVDGQSNSTWNVISAVSRSRTPERRINQQSDPATPPRPRARRMKVRQGVNHLLDSVEVFGADDIIVVAEFCCREADLTTYHSLCNDLHWTQHRTGVHLQGHACDQSDSCKDIIAKILAVLEVRTPLLDPANLSINRYPNGNNHKNFHRDAHVHNPELANGRNFSAIASFGGQRELLFKPYNGAGEDVCITVKNGSLCLFGCGVNATWLHGIEPCHGAQDRNSIACWGMSPRFPE
jgi:hypothetical protein